jgi:hypothetical protein
VTGQAELIEQLQRLSGLEEPDQDRINALWWEVDALSAERMGGTMNDRPMDPISPAYLEQMNDLARSLDAALNGAKFVLLVFEEPTRANYISNTERSSTVQALREVADRLDPPQ